MKVKVCGMRDAANIKALGQLKIDLIGFIFYPKSSRYAAVLPEIEIPSKIKRVGVFVNASFEVIEQRTKSFKLDYLQLHGDETPEYCQALHAKGYSIIKAFAVDEYFDFEQLNAYKPFCDFFLLDAKGKSYGGNGIQFNWNILKKYVVDMPFFLSGGIDLNAINKIQNLQLPQLYGIDVNSRFEISPGLKNIPKVKQLLNQKNQLKAL